MVTSRTGIRDSQGTLHLAHLLSHLCTRGPDWTDTPVPLLRRLSVAGQSERRTVENVYLNVGDVHTPSRHKHNRFFQPTTRSRTEGLRTPDGPRGGETLPDGSDQSMVGHCSRSKGREMGPFPGRIQWFGVRGSWWESDTPNGGVEDGQEPSPG